MSGYLYWIALSIYFSKGAKWGKIVATKFFHLSADIYYRAINCDWDTASQKPPLKDVVHSAVLIPLEVETRSGNIMWLDELLSGRQEFSGHQGNVYFSEISG